MLSPIESDPSCVCGEQITPDYAELFGCAVGTRMAAGRVLVGGDTRPSTPALKEALIKGLLSTGCEVYDLGILPAPALSFAKDRFWADGAVMVTGAHRPPQENGFKVTFGKFPATPLDMEELLIAVNNGGPFACGPGRLVYEDTLEPYASFLIARFVPADPLHIAVDTGNGAMRLLAAPILTTMGYQVTERNYADDDLFPDPGAPEHVDGLVRIVLDAHANLGVAFDGDGSRVTFVSEQGRVLSPDLVLTLLVRALLPYQPGSQVILDESYAPFVFDIVRRYGGIPTCLSAVGSGMKRAFLERAAVLGGDRWGHYFYRSMGGDDPLYTMLVLLRMLARAKSGIESLIADLV